MATEGMDFSYMLKEAMGDYNKSAAEYAASSFSKLAGGIINYNALKADAAQLKTEASNIELQAKERANILRQQFVEAMGAYQMNAAQRGISVGSMNVRSNIEGSAMSMGEDIAKAERNAAMKASALRTQAKIQKIRGKYQMFQSIIDSGEDAYKAGQKAMIMGGGA